MWKIGEQRNQVLPHSLVQKAAQRLQEFDLSIQDKAMLEYVIGLTIAPTHIEKNHIEEVRKTGFDDRELHDIVMIVACFSFMNRLADGTGVACSPKKQGFATELLGLEAWGQHMRWCRGDD